MVSKKGKRKIEYAGAVYYWYVSVNRHGEYRHGHRIHIISDDKKVHLQYPFIDTEAPVTPQMIRNHLKEHYDIGKETDI